MRVYVRVSVRVWVLGWTLVYYRWSCGHMVIADPQKHLSAAPVCEIHPWGYLRLPSTPPRALPPAESLPQRCLYGQCCELKNIILQKLLPELIPTIFNIWAAGICFWGILICVIKNYITFPILATFTIK